jgi:hypothetical protein
VVPYNPVLLCWYKAHINVEICASVEAIKYINKYIYKGCDQTTLQVQSESDEVSRHLQGRYIGPTEAAWQIYKFRQHEEFPPVVLLAVHLPDQQPVYFNPELGEEEICNQMETACLKLMAFFHYNAAHPSGPQYLYAQFPNHFVWDQKTKI